MTGKEKSVEALRENLGKVFSQNKFVKLHSPEALYAKTSGLQKVMQD